MTVHLQKAPKQALLAAIAMTGAFGSPLPVLAQGFTLEEVVVTARRREESLQSVPVAVSSFSASDLQSLNMTDTADLAAFSPSVHMEPPGGQNGTIAKVTLRGQVQQDTLITLDPSVGWYLDDIYLARPAGTNTSMFDVERVEILKGPQGTLYGRNTTGGTVKLVTTKADPSVGLTGFVTGGIGNYDQTKIGGAVNIPLVEDVLAVRLAALQDKVDKGWQKVTVYDSMPLSPTQGQAVGNRRNGTKDNELIRIGLTWQPSDDWNIQLGYEHNKSDISMASGNVWSDPGLFVENFSIVPNLAFAGVPEPTRSALIAQFSPLFQGYQYVQSSHDHVHLSSVSGRANTAFSETDTLSLGVEYDINENLSTKLVYGWRDLTSSFDTSTDGTSVPFINSIFPFEQNAEQHSVEWQLTGTAMDGALDWVTGLYWFEEDGVDFSRSGGLAQMLTGILYTSSYARAKNTSQSAFFQGTLRLTDRVNFTGGLRYTKDKKPIDATIKQIRIPGFGDDFCRFGADSGLPNADGVNCTWSDSDTYEYISWTAGFDWAVNEDVMAYLKGSSASRSGGQNARALTAETAQPFAEETATDIELGLKAMFFDNSLQINAAAYHTFYSDIQQTILIDTPQGLITQTVNRAEADISGIELEATWLVSDQFQLSGSAGHLDWKFGDNSSILPSAPTKEYTLRANYLIPVDYGQWLFDLNWSYRGSYPGNCAAGRACIRDLPSATSDSVSLVGGRIGVDLESFGVNVALWGRNLTNEKYSTNGLNIYSPPVATLSNVTMGNPRTFGLEATYRF